MWRPGCDQHGGVVGGAGPGVVAVVEGRKDDHHDERARCSRLQLKRGQREDSTTTAPMGDCYKPDKSNYLGAP